MKQSEKPMVLFLPSLPNAEITKTIAREISLIQHHNIVRLVTTFVVDDLLFLVMEKMRGDLGDAISDEVLDLGMIKTATPDYSAPEVLMQSNCYTIAVDLWSVGCIFVQMLEKSPPFEAMEVFDLFGGGNSGMCRGDFILSSIFRKLGTPSWQGVTCLPKYPKALEDVYPEQEFDLTVPLDDEGKELLNGLLCLDPQWRITAAEALQHPFLKDVRDGQRSQEYYELGVEGTAVKDSGSVQEKEME